MEQSPTTDRAVSLDEAIVDRDPAAAERAVGGGGRHLPQNPRGRARLSPTRCTSPACSPISRGGARRRVALIERSLELEPDRADWYSNLGIVLRDRLQAGRGDRRVPSARSRSIRITPTRTTISASLLRAQGKPVEAEAAYRAAIRVESRPLGRVHQPGHPAERPEADARSGRLLLQGHHAQAEAPRGAETAGAGALHARRGRQGGGDLRGMAQGGAGPSDRPAHAARRAPAAMSRRGRRTGSSRQTFDSFAASFDSKLAKLSYRAPALVAAMLADSELEASKSLDVLDAGCGTGLVRTARRAVCAPAGRRRSVRAHAGAGRGQERLRRAVQGRADRLPARLHRGVRCDRVGRHPRVFRTARGRGRGGGGRAASRRAAHLHRGGN